MMLGAAVSGYYFSHLDSRYFGVAEIGRDQSPTTPSARAWPSKWLSPNLAYDPKQPNGSWQTEVPQARSKSASLGYERQGRTLPKDYPCRKS